MLLWGDPKSHLEWLLISRGFGGSGRSAFSWIKSIAGTNGRRTAVQIRGVLQYNLNVHCSVSLCSRLRSQEGTALQMGGVLWYRLEVYCSTFLTVWPATVLSHKCDIHSLLKDNHIARDNRLPVHLSALAVVVTSYCHSGRHANDVTPCLLTPCLNLPDVRHYAPL